MFRPLIGSDPTRRRVLHGIGAGAALAGLTGEASAASGLAVTTDWADPLGDTEMVLGGTLTDLGGASAADVWFQYRKTGATTWSASASQELTTATGFSARVSNLETGTEYEYRAVAAATSSDATATGTTRTFTTFEDQPEVTTDPATDVDDTVATLNGTVTDIGGAASADVWFEYRQPTADTWQTTTPETLTSAGSYSQQVTGLEPESGYEYRAVAEMSDGDGALGRRVKFGTDWRPAVATDAPTDVGDTAATLNGTLSDLGGADSADVQFVYWRTDQSDVQTTSPQTLTSTGSFSERLTGLASDVTYEYHAFVATSDGDQDDGTVLSFTTDVGPTLVTDAPTDVDTTAATFAGEVTDFGGASSVDVWFAYFERGQSAGQTTPRQTLTDPGTVSERVDGLSPNTEYGVELRAEASDGDTGGGGVQYVTTDTRLAVSTTGATGVEATSATLNASVDDLGDAGSVTVTFEHRPVGASSWTTSGTRTVSSTGGVSVAVDGLQDGTDYEYRTSATASDGDAASGGTATFTTPVANEPPTVERLAMSDVWGARKHVQLEVEWAVADADGNLRDVTVAIRDGTGDLVFTDTASVSGSTASGATRTGRYKHAAGQDYTVTLTVADAAGETTTATRTTST